MSADPATLLLRLEGPLQAWGADGAIMTRPTQREPTLSGVVGLLANALGRGRSDSVEDLATLSLAVRCDAEGVVVRDYHTVGAGAVDRRSPDFPTGVRQADGKIPSDRSKRLVPTDRYMLADAAFICALHGDGALLGDACTALQAPRRPLYLGRKACPPSVPISIPEGLRRGVGPLDALAEQPVVRRSGLVRGATVRVVATVAFGEPWDRVARDEPVGAAFATRSFRERRTRTWYLDVSGEPPYPWVDPHDPLDVWIPGDVLV